MKDSISSSNNPLKVFDVQLIDHALRQESIDETEEMLSQMVTKLKENQF